MKIAICGRAHGDKQLSEKIEFVCKRHYRTVQIQNELEADCDMVFAVGVDAAKEIRRINEKIPIVLLCQSNEEALLGYEICVNNCIKKPFLTKRLETAIFDCSG